MKRWLVTGTCLMLTLTGCYGGLRGMSKTQVKRLCTQNLPAGAKPTGKIVWDDSEWAWNGTVRLSDARPAAQFSCVVGGTRDQPTVLAQTR